MEKRIFTLILVVIIGVMVGVGIVSKQGRENLIHEVLKRQDQMLAAQKQMVGTNNRSAINDVAPLVQKINQLESKLSTIETRLASLEDKAKNGAQAPVPQGPPPEDLSKVHEIPLESSYVRGRNDAPVTIVEFVDFQCPFCARFHPPVNEVLKLYPKQVKYILKNFPLSFHPEAKPAAKVALAAGEQGKYWEMADALLDNGRSLSQEKYDELAKSIGLNMKKFKSDLEKKDAEWEALIQKDITLGSQVDVRGTPTFYLNGKKTNARDVDSFKQQIDAILNK